MSSKKKSPKTTKPQPMDAKKPVATEEPAVPVEPETDPVEPTDPMDELAQEPESPEAVQTDSPQAPEPEAEPEPAPVPTSPFTPSLRDPRLPPVGSTLTRTYKGQTYTVEVLEDGFEYEGQRYGSLSKVAKVISGQTVNGFIWWGLGGTTGGKQPRTGGGTSARLRARITKLEKLTAKMRQALAEGALALADAEAEVQELLATVDQSNTAPEIATTADPSVE